MHEPVVYFIAGAVRRAFLTFDDGPDPRHTPVLLDVLHQHRVRATFFVLGECAQAHATLLRRIHAEGHIVANHGQHHTHPWRLSGTAQRAVVRDGAASIAGVLGVAPQFYRPAFGRLRQSMVDEADATGQRVVLWNRSAVDWGPLAGANAIARRLARVQAGDIVLMHDGQRQRNRPQQLLSVLPTMLQKWQARGLDLDVLPAMSST